MTKAIIFMCAACDWTASLDSQSLQTEGYLECPECGEQNLSIFTQKHKKAKTKKRMKFQKTSHVD